MFIATERGVFELGQEFNVPVSGELHFTPDGVSGPPDLVNMNIALLTEGWLART